MLLRKIIKIVLISLVLLFLLLQTAVQIGRDLTVQWLLDQGASEAGIHTLSVNWFTGKVRLADVSVMTPGQPDLVLKELQLDLDYGALLKQRILISELVLDGLSAELRQVADKPPQFAIGPVTIPVSGDEETAPAEPSAWLAGLDQLVIKDLSWQAALPGGKHTLLITEGDLNTFYMWQEQAITELKLKGALNGAQFNLDSKGTPLPETKSSEFRLKLNRLPVHSLTAPFVPELKATLSTDLVIRATMDEQISLTQEGSVSVDQFSWITDALNISQQKISWQGRSDIVLSGGAPESVTLKGVLDLAQTLFSDDAQKLELQKGQWKGDTRLLFNGQELSEISGNNLLALEQLTLRQESGLDLVIGSVDWQGGIAVDPAAQPLVVTAEQGALSVAGVHLRNSEQTAIAGIKQAALGGIDLNWPQQVVIKTGQVNGVRVAENTEQALAKVDLKLDQLRFVPENSLSIARLAARHLKVNEQLDKAGEPVNTGRLLAALDSLSGAESSPETQSAGADKEATAPLAISIAELTVSGDSEINFTDRGTEPAFASTIKVNDARLTGLHTVDKTPAQFQLGLQLNDFTTFDMDGATDIVAGGENANWKGVLKQLDLPRLSPYSIKHTGYYLQTGQLHLDSEGSLEKGKIEGNNHVQINRLEVEVADPDQMGKFSKKLSMPLGTAISILQDSDDNIDLDIPVSGSLDDPDFGLQSVVNRLAGKGLKQAAMSFLTKSLQPYGALISLAASVAKDGTFIKLAPVSFAPGSADLDSKAGDYLAKISSMMLDRKGMRLNICGQVVQQDQLLVQDRLAEENKKREQPLTPEALLEEEKARLSALSQQRSDSIKKYLVATIPGERLFSCFPLPVQDDPEAKPIATLGL